MPSTFLPMSQDGMTGPGGALLAELVPDARRRTCGSLPLCPACRSTTDVPRANPATGRPDRWCRACLAWTSSVRRQARGEHPPSRTRSS